MYRVKALLLAGLLLTTFLFVRAQEIIQPNYGLKNPETIEVIRVRITTAQTLVDMSIQNQVSGGYFCIDENTYLEYGRGNKLKMKSVSGLPLCPSKYEFSSIGEKVYFTLVFDKLPEGVECFDIVEYCGDNCFSILAINLDEDINEKINKAFNSMDRLEAEKAIEIFRELLPSLQSSGHGLTGSIYLNLVELLAANKRDDELRQLLNDFKTASMPHKQRYLEILRNLGY